MFPGGYWPAAYWPKGYWPSTVSGGSAAPTSGAGYWPNGYWPGSYFPHAFWPTKTAGSAGVVYTTAEIAPAIGLSYAGLSLQASAQLQMAPALGITIVAVEPIAVQTVTAVAAPAIGFSIAAINPDVQNAASFLQRVDRWKSYKFVDGQYLKRLSPYVYVRVRPGENQAPELVSDKITKPVAELTPKEIKKLKVSGFERKWLQSEVIRAQEEEEEMFVATAVAMILAQEIL